MKTKLIGAVLLTAGSGLGPAAWASLDSHLVGYANGDDVIKKSESPDPSFREEPLRVAEAIAIMERLAQDKQNRTCQVVGVDVAGHDAAEIIVRTGATFQLLRFTGTGPKIVEASAGEGPISQVAMAPLDQDSVQRIGDRVRFIQLRALNHLRAGGGGAGPGDTYDVLKIHYAESDEGPKLLKIEAQSYVAEGKMLSAPRLAPVGATSGACEPHKAGPKQLK